MFSTDLLGKTMNIPQEIGFLGNMAKSYTCMQMVHVDVSVF